MPSPLDNWGMGDMMPNGGKQSKLHRVVAAVGTAIETLILRKIKQADKQLDGIYAKAKRAGGTGFGGSMLGMGSVSPASGSFGIGLGSVGGAKATGPEQLVLPGMENFVAKAGPKVGFPLFREEAPAKKASAITPGRVALGLGAVSAGAAAVGYGMLPNVGDAVAQQLLAQSVASVNGMGIYGKRGLISTSNRMLAGGLTSSYGAQEAMAAMLANGGILMGTQSGTNIMRTVGGFSVLTGMSNAQVAGASSSINTMNLLRVGGIRGRDRQGNLLGANQIASQLYRRTWGNRKVSVADASSVYNPNSVSYANTMAAAGGNQDLFQMLAAYQVQMAKNGGKAISIAPEDVKKSMGLDKNSVYSKSFDYHGSESNKLEATGKSLTAGYSEALTAVTALNKKFAELANDHGPLSGVIQGMANLSGILNTIPSLGSTGSTFAGLGAMGLGMAGNMFSNYMMYKGVSRAVSRFMGRSAGGAGAAVAGEAGAIATGGEAAVAAAAGGGILRKVGQGSGVLRTLLRNATIRGVPIAEKVAQLGATRLGSALKFAGGKLLPGIGAALTMWDTSHVGGADAESSGGWNWAHFGQSALSGAATGAMVGGGWGALIGGVVNAANYGLSYLHGRGGDDSGASMANLAEEGRGGSSGAAYSYPTKGRSPREAVQWALNQAKTGSGQPGGGSWRGWCERFTRTAYGYPAMYPTAIAHWRDAVRTGKAHPGDLSPPLGALVFWSGGSKKWGHAAISTGGGNVVSTDAKRPGKADVVSIAHINRSWRSFKYEGWADPSHVKLAPGGASAGASTPMSASSSVNSAVSAGSSSRPARTLSNNWSSQDASPQSSAITDDFSSVVSLNDSFGAKLLSGLSIASLGNTGRGGGTMQDMSSTASITGFAEPGSAVARQPKHYTVNMNIKIERASVESAVKLAKTVKSIIESEDDLDRIGRF